MVDIGILIISSYGDREITQPNRIMSGPPLRISRWNQFGQLRWLSTNVISRVCIQVSIAMSQGFKRGCKWRSNRPTKLFLQLIQYIQIAAGSTSPHMTTIFNGRPSGIFIEIKSNFRSKWLHIMNQCSKFFGGSFSSRDNLRDKCKRERQSHYLKMYFFFKNKSIHFRINSTRVNRPIKQNKLIFSCIEINKPFPVPVHSVL